MSKGALIDFAEDKVKRDDSEHDRESEHEPPPISPYPSLEIV
jgi:hypothetical protein